MRWLDEQRRRRERAVALFADPASGLEARARDAWRGGFAGGAEWMRVALAAIRGGERPRGRAAFGWLGAGKYAACTGGALMAAVVSAWAGAGWSAALVAAVLAFYVVEVQAVFLFPVALDRGTPAWRPARRLMRADGGTVRAVLTVVPIAARMIGGGWRGWCRGCLEVLLWYEDVRARHGTRAATGRLTLGDGGPLAVRTETVRVAGLARVVRIAWISDLHLVRRSSVLTARSVLLAVRRLQPDVIVLGGDLVDGEIGLGQLARLVRGLTRVAPVWALPGNHDERFGAARVAATVRAAGGAWLPGVVATVAGGAVSLASGEGGPEGTLPSGVVVACLHAPARAARWRGRARLVLAGHLHGGQLVLAEALGRLWPCAFFFRWCGARFELAPATTLVVGCGAGDLLPIRWRCPREIVCVELVPARVGAEGGRSS